jgi:hypothetical protein
MENEVFPPISLIPDELNADELGFFVCTTTATSISLNPN